MCCDVYNEIDGNGISMLISSVIENGDEIYKAYKQVERIDKYFDIIPEKKVIKYNDILTGKENGPSFLQEINNIIRGIEKGKITLLMKQFEKIKNYIVNNKNLSINYIEAVYTRICLKIHKTFYNYKNYQMYWELFDKMIDIKNIIDNSTDFNEMHSSIRELVSNFYVEYNNSRNKKLETGDIIESAKFLIEKNFSDPGFSLQSLADNLRISVSYLSTLFKRELGSCFNDYVSDIRIKKPIEMLKNEDVSISEIGRKVGYTSEKYFFVVFKKYTGMTPGKYRRELNCRII